jgi:hypothetical protein
MILHAAFLAITLFADTAKAGDLTVTQVNDRRGKSFSHLMIVVAMPSIKTSDVAASRVLLTSAVDDIGTNLLSSEKQADLETNTLQKFGGDPGEPPRSMTVSFEMSNPPRSAKVVKEVRGDIELYMPSRDSNSTATIQKFMTKGGKPVSDRALKSNGVDLAIISKDQFEAMRKAAMDKYRAEKKAGGLDGDDLDQSVKDFAEYEYLKPDEGDVLVKLSDPNKRIQSIAYVTATGEQKQLRASEKNGITVLSMYGEKPADDWSMRVSLMTPKTLVRVPLVLTNVPLP